MSVTFRAARPDEAETLTRLALRSKKHWGYGDAFMEAARADMQISADLIARAVAVVAERGGGLLGFYVLSVEPEGPTLRDLWVEPAAIGTGVGALLWEHMLGAARSEGFRTVRLVSDPNAAGFYRRMGARAAGEAASCVMPGRMLPVFEIEVIAGG
jgi:GNAT superfamily N-acetyltransferase